MEEKTDNERIARAFQDRLEKVAGFKKVPEPIPKRNTYNATVYYLYFASQRPVAAKIVAEIFNEYRDMTYKEWLRNLK